MRSTSEAALAAVREYWESALVQVENSTAYGAELFSLSDALRQTSSVLLRTLTDASIPPEEREKLARNVLESKVDEAVLALTLLAVRQRWSEPEDLPAALERLGVDALLAQCEKESHLAQAEEELYRTVRLLASERRLRVNLADRTYEVAKRVDLAKKVFASYLPQVQELIVRAVERSERFSLIHSLNEYIARTAERGKHLLASVTVAQELSAEQHERLARILAQRYGKEVAIHLVVDTSILGGMRIHVGEDVIDGTLETRVHQVREAITR